MKKNQIKIQKIVSIIIDKETIEKMRKSLLDSHEKAIAGVGGIDPKIKNFGTKNYTIREDANWIRAYVNRKIVDHKLKFIVGGTEIHIMTDKENE